ncbi:MAG: tyrosine-type recombinase/integrase [Xanthobacteraceae bacterium]
MDRARRKAKATASLTVKRVAKLLRAGVPGRYLDRGDGRSGNQYDPVKGLYLVVNSPTSAAWEMRYQLRGKTRFMGLGSVRDFSLVQARDRARAARRQLADKIDPIEERRADRQAKVREAAENLTLKKAAEEFLQVHGDTWKNGKHRQQWANTLRDYAFPKLGERLCKAIDTAAINDAVAPIWATIPETASRVKQRIERVIQWVKDGKPLPTAKSTRKRKHPALPYTELPAFLAELRLREGIAARALEFAILCASRTNEVIGATRLEFDFSRKVWTIPAVRMKMEHEHRVPLSDRAIDLLRALPTEEGNPFMFIGAKQGKGLSNMALAEVVRQMNDERTRAGLPRYVDPKQNNRDVVPHGFRSTFRDWTADKSTTPNHVAEMALAHRVKGVEGDYRRGDLFEKRRQLMAAWARYGASPPRPARAEVVNLHEARI